MFVLRFGPSQAIDRQNMGQSSWAYFSLQGTRLFPIASLLPLPTMVSGPVAAVLDTFQHFIRHLEVGTQLTVGQNEALLALVPPAVITLVR